MAKASSRLERLITTAFWRLLQKGRTGRYTDPETQTFDPDPRVYLNGATAPAPNRIWVRLEDSPQATIAWNFFVSDLKPDVPVWVITLPDKNLYVLTMQGLEASEQYGYATSALIGPAVQPELNNDIVAMRRIQPLRPRWSSGLTIKVYAGWVAGKYTNEQTISLIAPPTSGNSRYALVGININTRALSVVYTPETTSTLSYNDINNNYALWGSGVEPIGAVPLSNGATTFTNADIVDMRSMITRTSTEVVTLFDDDTFRIQDNADNTKQVAFELSGLTTATIRTYTAPDASGILVLENNTATLSNKTLDTPTITDFTNSQHGHTDAANGGLLDASAIGSGAISHERGGLETDVSAFDGLVQISGGTTSEVTAPGGAIVGTSDNQTLTNKTIDGDDNTIQDVTLPSLKTVLADANKSIIRDASGAVVSSNRMLTAASETVFNDDGANIDFRVEGDTESNLLFVDAGNNRVGIGTNLPSVPLHIKKDGLAANQAKFESTTVDANVWLEITNDAAAWTIGVDGGASDEYYIYNVGKRLQISTSGAVNIPGTVTKGGGSFRIDHPLKPHTHYLVHSFVEAPQGDLIYRGQATLSNGQATVNLDTACNMSDGTFVALTKKPQVWVNNNDTWDLVRGSVTGDALTIECQNAASTAVIDWLVIAERNDPFWLSSDMTDENGNLITEPQKTATEALLHPKEYQVYKPVRYIEELHTQWPTIITQ